MKITDLLSKHMLLKAEAKSKEDALKQAIALMEKNGNLNDAELFLKEVLKREEEGSTGIGDGVAIPHSKTRAVSKAGLVFVRFPDGVEFDALDGEKVKLLFLIAVPDLANDMHLEILSQLSMLLMDASFVASLEQAKTSEEVFSIIDQAQRVNQDEAKEQDQIKEEIGTQKKQKTLEGKAKILAVTACPTGIAHTYMAAQALSDKAKEMGIALKVETRGSSGVKNELSQSEIEACDCIIIAADTQVPLDRFNGKRVIFAKVADGISKSQSLLEHALQGEGEIYHAKEVSSKPIMTKDSSLAHRLYKHLMNGISHMLPFVVGGGILIAIAFLIDGYYVDMQNASEGVKQAFGKNTELAKFFMEIGGLAFSFMLPLLSGFIALSIADRPALLVGFVGGAIAKDGGSGFLGAILAGFLAGYLILMLKKALAKLPSSLDGIKTILLYPILGLLGIALLMIFVIEPPVGYLNTALSKGLHSMSDEWKVLLGILLGGMMATDLGGPINKAAYVFGVAGIASGNYDVMAAVMVGGMVPPLAIALGTLLFKNKFTLQERDGGLANIVMGLSFITEGAIPVAARDPLRVLSSCMVGSGIAGGLSMYFNCTLMAPHGGIFVFPVVGGVFYYLLALLVGTLVGAVMLGILKKGVQDERN